MFDLLHYIRYVIKPDTFSISSISPWIVLFVMGLVVFSLLKEVVKPALIFFLAIVILMAFGIVEPKDFLGGASNQSIATIILLILITAALNKNFNTEAFFDKIFEGVKSPKGFMLRMTSYVAILSSVLNNTPVVAMMTPYVYNWCKKFGVHPSKLLIPLSYATILGGMLTVLGTSTNLVLNGFLFENNLQLLGFSDFFYLGILVTVTGIIYLYTVGYKLLPQNKEAFDNVKAKAPEYLVETEITESSKLVGGTVEESGLTNLKGVYLIEMHREGEVITPVSPTEIIKPLDLLIFMGKSETIIEIVNSGIGLRLPKHNENLEIVEAVVPANSSLTGQVVTETKLTEHYNAELLALSRNGEKISGKMDKMRLMHGDLLLLSVDKNFFENSDVVRDLVLLSKINKTAAPHPIKLRIALAIIAGVVGFAIAGLISLFQACLFILAGMLALKLFNFRDINKEIDTDLVVLLVSALTLGNALISTGAAEIISSNFIRLFYPFGILGILIGLFILTVLLTSFVTNVAAVSIAFPVAYSISNELGTDGTPLFIAIAFAASAAFITPISYQTNWMVYGPGGYTSKDFMRVGFPLAIIYSITCITFIYLRYF